MGENGGDHRDDSARKTRFFLSWVVGVIAVVLMFLLLWYIPIIQVNTAGPSAYTLEKDRDAAENEFRKTWAQIFGGLIAGLLLVAAFQRANAASRAAEAATQSARAIEQGNITDRFTRAIDQLGKLNDEDGSPHEVIRIGGIYALEQIARDDPVNYHRQIVEILAAYVRMSIRWDLKTSESKNAIPEKAKEDIHAALGVIGRLGPMASQRIDLRGSMLKNPILSELNFENADFRGSILPNCNFNSSQMNGSLFSGSNLQGGYFKGANMRHTNFPYCDLRSSPTRTTDFSKTELVDAKFVGAVFKTVNFHEANLEGADFTRATGLKLEEFQLGKIKNTTIFPSGKSGYTNEEILNWGPARAKAEGFGTYPVLQKES